MTKNHAQSISRRRFLKRSAPVLGLILPEIPTSAVAALEPELYPNVKPGQPLNFPRDHGAHPDYRTEWWYLTAWLDSTNGPMGLQVTFFRTRTPYARGNPSRFAPQQLILAHAALANPENGKLLHDQQSWRAGESVAQFSASDTDLAIGLASNRWSMMRTDSDQYVISVMADQFEFNITATPPATIPAPVLQGDGGYSKKGPGADQASFYYSRPQLRIEGAYRSDNTKLAVSGTGWLDHEWSTELLGKDAAGWDWVGLNFHDGSALMAFQMRSASGGVLHSAQRHVSGEGQIQHSSEPTIFEPLRYWVSPRTDARYPVSVRLKVGTFDLVIEPLLDDQELDSRASTGVVYWEGAVQVWFSRDVDQSGAKSSDPIATGYLELTGYAGDLSI
ncbi:MAG: lipocalin-like domain-containing protein [Granulosicoccaceae bacterium]